MTGPEWKFRLQDVSHSSPNVFQCNLYPTVLHHRLRCKQETRMIIPPVRLTVLKFLVSCYLKENQFWEFKANIVLASAKCVCVWGQLQHLFTSKKKRPQCSQTVLSTAQVPVSTEQCRTKNIYNRIPLSFFMWLVNFLFCFFLNQPGSAQFRCAVTRLGCEVHLKQWHSGGPIVTVAHDEEERCAAGRWGEEPPLSANTRWSTEPPWIL